jgi:hypothetical protein
MDIEIARTIAMSEILQKTGAKIARQTGNDQWYISPFRNEKTPSFKVNTARNIWYDFGEGRGGDNIDFVCVYLERSGADYTVSDALRWLGNMFSASVTSPLLFPVAAREKEESSLVLKSVKPLTHIALVRYLEDRGIPKGIAQKYLKEITIYNKATQKEYFAAAIKNEDGGYDYRNAYFKGCVRKKAISFVRGAVQGGDGIHIFEGFMDFLSVIAQRNGMPLSDDVIILNSVSSVNDATAYIRGFGYQAAYTWLDNDTAGKKAAEALDTFFLAENIQHKPMNACYASHKDVNEAHMHFRLQPEFQAFS